MSRRDSGDGCSGAGRDRRRGVADVRSAPARKELFRKSRLRNNLGELSRFFAAFSADPLSGKSQDSVPHTGSVIVVKILLSAAPTKITIVPV
jgi:hypothetical protein